MAEIVISCAGDLEFAKEVYDYLYSKLQKLNGDQGIQVSKELVSLAGDEIYVDHKSLIPKGMIKRILESLLASDPVRFKEHRVIEFGDTFTVGILLRPEKMEGMHTCSFCGYFTPYIEELHTHRMTHYGFG
ncbi:MAG: hypothetical protein AB1351_02695 [Thermoproteota archaeon]